MTLSVQNAYRELGREGGEKRQSDSQAVIEKAGINGSERETTTNWLYL